MANHQIAVHDAVCNQDTTEFDNLPIGSLVQAAVFYRDLARRAQDEGARPINASTDYFDDMAEGFARKCDLAHEVLERKRPLSQNQADTKYRALIEWYSSTGATPEKVLTVVQRLTDSHNLIH